MRPYNGRSVDFLCYERTLTGSYNARRPFPNDVVLDVNSKANHSVVWELLCIAKKFRLARSGSKRTAHLDGK